MASALDVIKYNLNNLNDYYTTRNTKKTSNKSQKQFVIEMSKKIVFLVLLVVKQY